MSSEEQKKYGSNAKDGVKDFDFRILTLKLIDVIDSVKR